MNCLWKLWVTLTLFYLLLARSHGGPGFSWVLGEAGAAVRWGVEVGHISDWLMPAKAQDIVIEWSPCNGDGSCRDGEP
jgi:hypothetical protein